MGDDRVLPVTRVSAWVVAAVLTTAAVVLYGFPGETARLWAWVMEPDMTGLTVGGGYLAGAVFFVRAVRHGRWHAMAVGVLAATVLTILLLLATLLHWDKFSHGHIAFWVWFVVYLITPVYLPWLWVHNRRHDPGAAAGGQGVPSAVRLAVGAGGAVLFAVGLGFYARPELAIDVWPWSLTPLTARTISAFVAFVAATWIALLFDARWSAHRLHLQSSTLGLALVAAGALRAPGDFTGEPASVATFAVLLGGALVGLLALQVSMHRRAREPVADAVPETEAA